MKELEITVSSLKTDAFLGLLMPNEEILEWETNYDFAF